MPGPVFISYSRFSRPDAEYVARLVEHLRAAGIAVLTDDANAVPRPVEAACAVLVVLTASAVDSSQVRQELSYAGQRRIPLVALMLEDSARPAGIAAGQVYDVRGGALPDAGLVDNLRRWSAGQSPPPVPPGPTPVPAPTWAAARVRRGGGRRAALIAGAIAAVVAVTAVIVVIATHGDTRNDTGGDAVATRTTTVLGVQPLPGVDPPDLDRVAQIVQHRLAASGFGHPDVRVTGAAQLTASVDGNHPAGAILAQLRPAMLRLRKVLNMMADLPDSTPPAGSSQAGSPPAGSTPAGSTPAGSTPAGSTPAGSTQAPSPPSATTSPAAGGSPGSGSTSVLQQSILNKLGPDAVNASTRLAASEPADLSEVDPATVAALEPFRRLTPTEVAILPVSIQFYVPQVTCEKLNNRPAGSIVDKDARAVACEDRTDMKMLLDKAPVDGSDVSRAEAGIDMNVGGRWKVDLTFSSAGAAKWSALTEEAFNNTDGACAQAATTPRTDGVGQVCSVAMVLDTTIISAPAIQSVLSDRSTIIGNFDRTGATTLAAELTYGELPATVAVISIAIR